MRIVVSPGQGAQKPGLLSPWLDDPATGKAAQRRLAAWSEAAQTDLLTHGTISPAEVIADTAIAQPLLLAAALLSFDAAQTASPQPRLGAGAVAGHSVGEFAAAAIAGVLTEDDAFRTVGVRGRAMATCAAAVPTGMAAVVGGDPTEVIAAITAAGAQPANFNGPGQVVAGGSLEALAKLAANPPTRARVIKLQVAGAFHTNYMAEAQAEVEAALAQATVRDPAVPFISNLDGQAVTQGPDVVRRLIAQVTAPVRWDLVLAAIAAEPPVEQIELAPAGVLTGLAKRAFKDLQQTPGALRLISLAEPADLTALAPAPAAGEAAA
ncbi:MAG: ACP S-malonyltransferase, partial [Bifidobacteriaceae bacterium]|nr:ACP S-malonyltransferase [Bifidobacteriaceae bacterium]